MQLQLTILNTGEQSAAQVSELVFNRDYNEGLIHQVVTAYMAEARQATRAQQTKAEVRGGGKKPWKQKGTGRARAGSIRSPIWVGGGRAHPATPLENFSQKVNKKMYRTAMCSILSELNRQGRLIVVDAFTLEEPKTKLLLTQLNKLILSDVLIVLPTMDDIVYLAARNLYHVDVQEAKTVDPVSLIGYEKVLITLDALKQLEERLV